jgi:glutamyl-tRNA synthetase
MGYLPAALRNYLVRLGWSHGDDEIFSTEQAIEWFGLDGLGRSPARFDFAKLENLNGHYIRYTDDDTLLAEVLAFLPHAEGGAAILERLDDRMRAKLRRALPGLKERAKTLVELLAGARFLFAKRPLPLDAKAQQLLSAEGKAVLASLLPVLDGEWSASALESAVKEYSAAKGLKLGALAQPLRAALTGTSTSPGIFDVLEVLGREESLARIRDQVG